MHLSPSGMPRLCIPTVTATTRFAAIHDCRTTVQAFRNEMDYDTRHSKSHNLTVSKWCQKWDGKELIRGWNFFLFYPECDEPVLEIISIQS